MSHETHDHGQETEKKSKTSFRSAFWFVIIVVGLFIAALNFVKSESNSTEEGHEVTNTTAHGEGHEGAAVAEPATDKAPTTAVAADTTTHTAAPAEEAHH